MRTRYALSLAAMLLAGCTTTVDQNITNGDLHLPLTYDAWQTNHYTAKNGLPVCAITTGYNSITVTMALMKSGTDVVVSSNKTMEPGDSLLVSVGGKNFTTTETYFKPEIGRSLVNTMASGPEKMYLDWTDVHAPVGRTFMHVQNIVRLGDFKSKLDKCRDTLETGKP